MICRLLLPSPFLNNMEASGHDFPVRGGKWIPVAEIRKYGGLKLPLQVEVQRDVSITSVLAILRIISLKVVEHFISLSYCWYAGNLWSLLCLSFLHLTSDSIISLVDALKGWNPMVTILPKGSFSYLCYFQFVEPLEVVKMTNYQV